MNGPAVTIEELSRYIDGQVTPEERADIEARMTGCAVSQRRLQRLTEVTKEIGEAISEQPPVVENAPTMGCLDDDTLIRLVDNQMGPAELNRVEANAASCNYCLRRLCECARSAMAMEVSNWKELPAGIRNDPRLAPLRYVKPRPRKVDFGDVVRGAMACDLNQRQPVSKAFNVRSYTLTLTVAPQRDKLANIEFLITDNEQPSSQTEIIVTDNQTAASVFRGSTSLDGRSLIRRMRSGVYDVFFPAANLLVVITITATEK